MATLSDWNAYVGVLQELAYIEDDLLEGRIPGEDPLVDQILYERFGVDNG